MMPQAQMKWDRRLYPAATRNGYTRLVLQPVLKTTARCGTGLNREHPENTGTGELVGHCLTRLECEQTYIGKLVFNE